MVFIFEKCQAELKTIRFLVTLSFRQYLSSYRPFTVSFLQLPQVYIRT